MQQSNAVLDRLNSERDEQIRFVDETLARVEADGRDLVDAERANLASTRDRIKQLDEQIAPLQEFEQLRAAHRETSKRYTPAGGGEVRPATRTEPRGHEYRTAGEVIVDRLAAFDTNSRNHADAIERLETAGLTVPGSEARALVHQTTANTPSLLPDVVRGDILNDIDAARPFMESVGVQALNFPGKTFERPKVTQHTQVGEQAAEKDVLASRQLVIGNTPMTKRTFGGALNVSRQAIDWTSPAAWDAIVRDLMEQYALETENAAGDAFAAAVTQTVENAAAVGTAGTLAQIATAFYGAASLAYAGVKRLPDTVWMSLDMWALYGPVLDGAGASALNFPGVGTDSSVTKFQGQVMQLPRIVVPSFPNGTIIVGVKSKTEVYEERIGLLQAVQPSVLGVEIAYGGYIASGTVQPTGFAKIINAA